MAQIWTICSIIKEMVNYFEKLNFINPRLDVELLLASTLNVDRVWLYTHPNQPLTLNELSNFKKFIIRRINREPIQYIIGYWGFWSFDIEVESGVFIPRPETESLIEAALRIKPLPKRIIDLCTGSGNIIIALAKEIKEASCFAVDISDKAFNLSKKNAKKNKVDNRINFILGDLFEPLDKIIEPNSIDLVISNPPYIPVAQIEKLQPEISRFEPHLALDGGIDGLDFYHKIIQGSISFLKPGGFLIMELDYTLTESIIKMIENQKAYDKLEIIKDYNKQDRAVVTKKGGFGFG